MKKRAKNRRRVRPHGESLEPRLAPLTMMDLGIGALVLSDLTRAEGTIFGHGTDKADEASRVYEIAGAQSDTFGNSQISRTGDLTSDSDERESSGSKAIIVKLELPNSQDSVDGDLFEQLAFYKSLTALDASTSSRTPSYPSSLEGMGRSEQAVGPMGESSIAQRPSDEVFRQQGELPRPGGGYEAGVASIPPIVLLKQLPKLPVQVNGAAVQSSEPVSMAVAAGYETDAIVQTSSGSSREEWGQQALQLENGAGLFSSDLNSVDPFYEALGGDLDRWSQSDSSVDEAAVLRGSESRREKPDRPTKILPIKESNAFAGPSIRLAGPQSDTIVPYQRNDSSAGAAFRNEFVVELSAGASSESLAQRFGAKHVYAYPNLSKSLNIWSFSDDVLPNGKESARSFKDEPDRQATFLKQQPLILDAYPIFVDSKVTKGLPNDPLIPAQWHLYNVAQAGGTTGVDGNVQAAWDLGVSGKGVTIGIVDDGLQFTHPDISSNYDAAASYDFNFNDDDPSPTLGTNCNVANCHGTAAAGVAASVGGNNEGGSGVAPDAKLGGIRLIAAGTTDSQEAEALDWDTTKSGGAYDGGLVDIFNNSWGPFDDGTIQGSGPLFQAALSDSTNRGRGGLGSIYTWAGGNGRTANDNANYDGYANNRHVIAVAATNQNGSFATYSEPGAPLLISAPSSAGNGGEGITTTDLVGVNGYHGTDYTDDFGGTSSAAPFVSGVIALMLEANPNLTWRDVQHILVRSATQNDSTNTDWTVNGGGRLVNHNYGFGMVNASGAVSLARNWQTIGAEVLFDSASLSVSAAIPTTPTFDRTEKFTVPQNANLRVEHVEIVFDATHSFRGNLAVTLTSPSGTKSRLAESRSDSGDNYSSWQFSSTRHWDEPAAGEWTLRVTDLVSGDGGTWNNWRLKIYGTEVVNDSKGPRLTGVTDINGLINGGSVSSFKVQFDEPVAPSTFTASDVNFTRVGGSAITVSNVTPVTLPGIPALSATFEGINFDEDASLTGFLQIPPDPIGAAGLNHVVSVVNSSIEWHTKAGVQQHSQKLQNFFAPLTPVNLTFDPKVIYDQHANRFLVVTLEKRDTAVGDSVNSSRILVAVSDNSDPNGSWYFQAINSKITIGSDTWADYPGFAADEEAIYITNNMFTFGASPAFVEARLWILSKGIGTGGFYDGGTGTVTIHDPSSAAGLPGQAFTLQPAHIYGIPGSSTFGTFLVNSGWTSGPTDFHSVIRVDNPLSSPTFTNSFVNLGDVTSTSFLPDAPQLGSSETIETNDTRALNAVWRNDRLYLVNTVVPPSGPNAGEATAHWYEINTTTMLIAQQGDIGGEDIAPDTHTFFPSIAVDASGNVAVGFAASAATIYAGAYYTGRTTGDTAGTMRASGTLAAGQDWYLRKFSGTRNRWGDYSGISVDPANDAAFWVFNEYARPRGTVSNGTQDGRWGTRWGSFSFAPTSFTVSFASQSTAGNYRVSIGPDIKDLNGNSVNQDGDATNGEALQDKLTEHFTLADQFIYSNVAGGDIPDGSGSLTRTFSLPAVNVSDLNVLFNIFHDFPSFDLEISLSAPGVGNTLIADNNTANNSSSFGYLDTILDDDNVSDPLINATTSELDYTDRYRPTNSLSAFDGSRSSGTWTLTVSDVVGDFPGTFNYASLILARDGIFDVALDSVTNSDSDRDKVEVTYTISGATTPSFDLGIFDSFNPTLELNGDTSTGTFTVDGTNCEGGLNCLSVGTHTVKVNTNLFPDPTTARNRELFSLVVVDPQHNISDEDRANNFGILSGLGQTPDGTLHVSGNPFANNTITITNSDVNINGTPISYNAGVINEIIVTGGLGNDSVNATGVNKNIFAFLGMGNDTYIGGNLIDAVQGGGGDDSLTGNDGNDRLYGMAGADILIGGTGNDLLSVGAGQNQTLDGGVDGDVDRFLIEGTVHNDHIIVWDPDGNPGTVGSPAIGSTLEARVQNPINPIGIGAEIIQSVLISNVSAADLLYVGSGLGDDLIQLQQELPNFTSGVGSSIVGINAIIGAAAGSDTIYAGRGADQIFGDQYKTGTVGAGDGNDTIDARDGIAGNDILWGAGGTNTLQSDSGDTNNNG